MYQSQNIISASTSKTYERFNREFDNFTFSF